MIAITRAFREVSLNSRESSLVGTDLPHCHPLGPASQEKRPPSHVLNAPKHGVYRRVDAALILQQMPGRIDQRIACTS
jgi:hypothetical protein